MAAGGARAGTWALAALGAAVSAAGCRSAPMPVSQIYDPITPPRGTWTLGSTSVYRAPVSDYRTAGGDADGELTTGGSPLRYAATDRLEVGLGTVRYAVARGDDDGSAPRGPLQLAVGLSGAIGSTSGRAGGVTMEGGDPVRAQGPGLIAVPAVEVLAALRVGRVRLEGGVVAIPVTVNTALERLVGAHAGATAQLLPAIAVGVQVRGRVARDEAAIFVAPQRVAVTDRVTAGAGLAVTLRWRLARTYDVILGSEITGDGQRHTPRDEPRPDDFGLSRLSGAIWQLGAIAGVRAYW